MIKYQNQYHDRDDIAGLPTAAGAKLHNDSRPGSPSLSNMIIIITIIIKQQLIKETTLCRQIRLWLSFQ